MPDRLTAVLEAVALAAERLLAAPSWEEGIQEVLARLGEAAEVSRAYVFENAGSGEGLRSVLRHEWTAPGVPPEQASGPASTSYGGFERWVRELARGETVHGHVQDFPPSERPLLERLGVRSIAVAPVFVDSRWWGVLGFDDCSGDRDWSGSELDALRAAARMIGAALQRGGSQDALVETGQRLRAQNAFLEALHETTLGLINRLDAQEVVEAILTRRRRTGTRSRFGWGWGSSPSGWGSG